MTLGVRNVIQPVSQSRVLLQLVTRKLEDGVEREKKLYLSCSSFTMDALLCSVGLMERDSDIGSSLSRATGSN